MHRQLLLCFAMSVVDPSSASNRPVNSNPDFEVSAACKDQSPCVFKSRDIHFNISIKNTKSTPIHLPLEYIRFAGPMVKLHDNRSARSVIQPTPMRRGDLLSNLTVVAPGQSVTVAGFINAYYLRTLGGTEADVTAVVTLGAPLDSATEARLIGTAQFRIVGADVAHRPGGKVEK